jgi:sugar lactone lactonase YvrE
MAYDKYGNLWVANNRPGAESIVMFSWDAQKQQGVSGQPPNTVFAVNTGGGTVEPNTKINGAWGLDFDADGNLWVSTENAGLIRLAETDLYNKPFTGTPTRITPNCQVAGANTDLMIPQQGDPKQLAVHSEGSQTVILVANPGRNVKAGTNQQNRNEVYGFDVTACGKNPANVVVLKNPPAFTITSASQIPGSDPGTCTGATCTSRPWGIAITPGSTLTDMSFWISGSNGALNMYSVNWSTRATALNKTIAGGNTQMNQPQGITIGPGSNQLGFAYSIWVSNSNPNLVTAYVPNGGVLGVENQVPLLAIQSPNPPKPGPKTNLDDPSGVVFDPEGRLWVSNSTYQSSADLSNALRRYLVGPPLIPFNPIPPFVPPVNPTASPTPTPSANPTPDGPNPRSPWLIVDARKASKKIKFMKKTQIVNWEGTDGELTKIKTKCFLNKNKKSKKTIQLKGKAERVNCGIKKKKGVGRYSTQGSKAITVKPSCTVGLSFQTKVVAKFPDFPGAKTAKWKRSWKVKNRPRTLCRIPGTG